MRRTMPVDASRSAAARRTSFDLTVVEEAALVPTVHGSIKDYDPSMSTADAARYYTERERAKEGKEMRAIQQKNRERRRKAFEEFLRGQRVTVEALQAQHKQAVAAAELKRQQNLESGKEMKASMADLKQLHTENLEHFLNGQRDIIEVRCC